jgi:hypothetical protein
MCSARNFEVGDGVEVRATIETEHVNVDLVWI